MSKKRSGRKQSLDVIRPVLNIGEKELAALKRVLRDGDGKPLAEPDVIRMLLNPARSAQAKIISHSELIQAHKEIGLHGRQSVGKGHIDKLSAYLGSVLSRFPAHVNTPTLSVEKEPLSTGNVLSIAGSPELVEERALAKRAIARFYDLEAIPPEVWLPDESVTQVWLARSYDSLSDDLLQVLETGS